MVASLNACQNGIVSSAVGGAANGVITNGAVNTTNVGKTLTKGKYTLVGIDIDTTGRRLIDEVSIHHKTHKIKFEKSRKQLFEVKHGHTLI